MEYILINKENNVIDTSIAAISYHEFLPTQIKVTNQANVSLLIEDILDNSELVINVEANAILNLSILAKEALNNCKITINLYQNSQLFAYLADFSEDAINFDCTVNLLESKASVKWRTASLAAGKDKKNIVINIEHISPETFGRVDNYGVSRDESKLLFAGTSLIKKGAHSSKTIQNAKIMVFDSKSVATAKPILKIDENDIEASHSAGVGKVNDEHLFYLTSRGLTTAEARKLITLGYLKPIIEGFKTEKYQTLIDSLIERRL